MVWHASWSITGDILAISGGDNKVSLVSCWVGVGGGGGVQLFNFLLQCSRIFKIAFLVLSHDAQAYVRGGINL